MPAPTKPVRDLLITAIETNNRHGVGILLQRFFGEGRDFICLRTTSPHEGHEPFGSEHHELCSRFLTDRETEYHLRRILDLYEIRRILVVPYYREEFVHATIAKRLTKAPLCTYLMDDQNIFAPCVTDRRVRALLDASDLCLAISPEMCAAYSQKYGCQVHLLPPLIESTSQFVLNYWRPEPSEAPFCAMIGNVWTAKRFAELRKLIRDSGVRVHWYGNGARAHWLDGTPEEWEQDGIETMGFLPEEDLIAAIASYPFVLVPSGTLDENDDNPAFSHLSLPSRLVFLHAHTDTPVLLLGHPETAAGRFVRSIGSGVCARHDPVDIANQAADLCADSLRSGLQRNIRNKHQFLRMDHIGDWIWASLRNQTPLDAGFQQAFQVKPKRFNFEFSANTASLPSGFQQLAFTRTSHLHGIKSLAALSQADRDELEISHFCAHLAAAQLNLWPQLLNDALFLGDWLPPVLENAMKSAKVWRPKDLNSWRKAGFAGDPACFVTKDGENAHTGRLPTFDLIVSIGWAGSLPNDYHAHEGLSLFLEACTRPKGLNLHFFAPVLSPCFLWVPPAYEYLRKRFRCPSGWPTVDDLLGAQDPGFMSAQAYEKHWQPSTRKASTEFGRVFGIGLAWPQQK
jgi:hypothetical protein